MEPPLKKEEKDARVMGSFRDLRSPRAGRLFAFPALPGSYLQGWLLGAKEAPFKFQLCCFTMLGRVL